MRKLLTCTLILSIFAGPASAAFNARNGLRVSGTAQEFEVFGRSGGTAVFCAAGDFARRKLGAASNDRVVLVRPFGPSPTQPTQRSTGFVLTGPEGRTAWGGGVLPFTGRFGVGQNRTVGHAAFLCETPQR